MQLFETSLKNHQMLLDIIKRNSDEDGVCRLSRSDMAKIIGKSLPWVNQAIERINRESVCIASKNGGYYLLYENILEEGTTFHTILNLLELFEAKPEFVYEDEKQLSNTLHIQRSTLQAAKAYYNSPI